jgi:DNA-binding MarR family transcriptional regulator
MRPRFSAGHEPNYRAMAEFRYQIRRFLRFSEHTARSAGLEPQQYQLLLAVRGMPDGAPPRIGDLAERLQIQHHSTVELVDRLVRRALVKRHRGESDRREVMLELTPRGEKLLSEVAGNNRAELKEMGPLLVSTLKKVLRDVENGRERPASTQQGRARPRSSRAG